MNKYTAFSPEKCFVRVLDKIMKCKIEHIMQTTASFLTKTSKHKAEAQAAGYCVSFRLQSASHTGIIVKTVKLVDLIEMHKTDCFGEARLVLHVSSSS